jgi:hypothetical protein
VARGNVPVITVVTGSSAVPVAECALRIGRSGHKDRFEGLARNNVGLPLPAISQVTAVDDQFGTHTPKKTRSTLVAEFWHPARSMAGHCDATWPPLEEVSDGSGRSLPSWSPRNAKRLRNDQESDYRGSRQTDEPFLNRVSPVRAFERFTHDAFFTWSGGAASAQPGGSFGITGAPEELDVACCANLSEH